MSIEVVNEFFPEASIRTRAYVYNDDGTLAHPSSAFIELLSPSGATVVAGTAEMSSVDAGIFDHYYYTASTAPSGWYSGKVKIVDGSGATAKNSFQVVSFKIR